MSVDGFMSMNAATCRYFPIEKDDDLPNPGSVSIFPRIGTAGHTILLIGNHNYRWLTGDGGSSCSPAMDWEDALEQLSMIRL